MSNNEELLKSVNIQEIADKGTEIYEKIKGNFEPQNNGKFLAIDIESEDVYLGATSSYAVEEAKKAHPDTVFFVVKIGYSVADALADMSFYAYKPN